MHPLRQWLGIEADRTSHREKLLSMLGAFIALAGLLTVNREWLDLDGALLVLASMGASAVLLFAVPHGALSQPWSLVGGHLLSAAVGVSCQQLLPGHLLTPALATAGAVVVMHYLRCIHPPGGATALAAVAGGPEIHQLGFDYLLTPVLSSVLVMLTVAILFNAPFPWRRYPAALVAAVRALPAATPTLTHEDVAAALRARNSFVDVTEEELAEIFELALAHASQAGEHPAALQAGACYSNGQIGRRWSVRQIIDLGGRPQRPLIVYKTVAGDGAYETGVCRRDEFMRWARFQVALTDGQWTRVNSAESPPQPADAAA